MSTYIYIPTERTNLFTVGFYDPSGQFVSDSDHTDREAAAKRVRFLNGGDSEITRLSEVIENTNTLLRSNQGEITMLRGHLQEAKRANTQMLNEKTAAETARNVFCSAISRIACVLGVETEESVVDAVERRVKSLLQEAASLGQWKAEMMQLERICNFNELARILGAPIGVECRAWVKSNISSAIEAKTDREEACKTLRAIGERLTVLGIPDSQSRGFLKGDRMLGELERLNLFIEKVRDAANIIREAPELNMNNYNEDEVRTLNNQAIEAHQILAALFLNDPAPVAEPEARTFNYVCTSCMKPFSSDKPLTVLICDDCVPF